MRHSVTLFLVLFFCFPALAASKKKDIPKPAKTVMKSQKKAAVRKAPVKQTTRKLEAPVPAPAKKPDLPQKVPVAKKAAAVPASMSMYDAILEVRRCVRQNNCPGARNYDGPWSTSFVWSGRLYDVYPVFTGPGGMIRVRRLVVEAKPGVIAASALGRGSAPPDQRIEIGTALPPAADITIYLDDLGNPAWRIEEGDSEREAACKSLYSGKDAWCERGLAKEAYRHLLQRNVK